MDYLADKLFIDHKVKVEFGREYKLEGSEYIIIFCKVRKKDSEAFKEALSKVCDKALLMGYDGYESACKLFLGLDKY